MLPLHRRHLLHLPTIIPAAKEISFEKINAGTVIPVVLAIEAKAQARVAGVALSTLGQ